MKKTLRELLIKREYGFTETFSRDMTTVRERRGKLTDLEGNQLDIAEWADKQCQEKCGLEPTGDVECANCIDCCHRCDIPMIYLSLVKLLMMEELIGKIEVTGEDIKTQIK